jgi:outer membrane immunogenic protein
MRHALFITAAALVFAGATPAFAQDDNSFSGIHVDGLLGWDNFSAGAGDGTGDSKDDLVYGASVGYDFEFGGGVVLGAEAELTGTGVKADVVDVAVTGDHFHTEAGTDIYVGARLGYAVSPQFMIYAKGGWTNLSLDSAYYSGVGDIVSTSDGNQDGFRVGAGLEYMFGQNFYVKGEYRYSHYGQNIEDFDVDVDRNQIVAGVGLRF